MDKGRAAYETASELEPYHSDIWLDYSNFFADFLGDYTKALDILEDGIYFQGDNSALIYRRVAYLYEMGRNRDAILELFIALTMDFEAHTLLLDYSENIRQSIEIRSAIESFKNR
jgi:tetratricopeptide (TPR) repeat protein